MHDVRRGVGAGGRLTPRRVDLAVRVLIRADLSRFHDARMHDGVRSGPLRVDHADHARRGSDEAVVADLAAALRIERRDVEEHTNVLALFGDGF